MGGIGILGDEAPFVKQPAAATPAPSFYLFSMVLPGQMSVRNGEAGSPSAL